MFNVGPGSVINLTSFTHYTPNTQIGFKPPKGMVAVFMLLGNADKKNPDSFDCEQALRRIGWAPMHEVPNKQIELELLQEQRDELLKALLLAQYVPLTGNPTHQELVEFWEYEKTQGRGDADDQLFILSVIAKAKGGAV